VIFITEPIAKTIGETLARYERETLPAIVPIPGVKGGLGLGMARMRQCMEKAVGVDILPNEGR